MSNLNHIFYTALVLLLFSSCKTPPLTPEDKAKELISKLFEARENHTYGYKAGAFGKLDSAYTTYREDTLFKVNSDRISQCLDNSTLAFTKLADIGYRTDTTRNERKKEALWKELLAASAEQKLYNDSASLFSAKIDSLKKQYKPFFKGWKITHEYKANNAFGIPVAQKTTFYFDVQLTKITGPEEIVKFMGNKL